MSINTIEEVWGLNELQLDIWKKKYQHNGENFEQWLNRVSGGNEAVAKLIKEKKFLFAGRILANRGLQHEGLNVTFSNCYVLPSPQDNLGSIFDTARDMAITYSTGGGVGISLRNLRPNNFRVHNNAKTTSGSVSFMDLYSLTTLLIGQKNRRGALMISIPSNHPDVLEFIDVKTDLSRVTGANISLEVDNAFIEAVKSGSEYTLKFHAETGESVEKKVDAKEVYRKLIENNIGYSEPGMLFWDNVKENHFMSESEGFEFAGTNPCGEQPLPPGGSCLLGSINLSEFVKNPFTPNAVFDYSGFAEAIEIATIGLNEVLDEGLPLHPLKVQRETVGDLRQIGLGVMGIADMLIKLGIAYGSTEAVEFSKFLSEMLLDKSVQTSTALAKVHGAFPKYKWEEVSKSKFFKNRLTKSAKEDIEKYGLRNSQILTIAPTGSISTMLGVSGGIEPTFAFSFTRTTKTLHEGGDFTYNVDADIVREFKEATGFEGDKLPSYFVASHNIDWLDRIKMQAAWQENIDASISSTINLGADVELEEVMDLYIRAWEHGLKGATIFHAGGFRQGILVAKDNSEEEQGEEKVKGYFSTCMECGSENVKNSNGCVECQDCGFTPCS